MIIEVKTFDTRATGKDQSCKVLEEAAETYAAWIDVDECLAWECPCRDCETDGGRGGCAYKRALADEIADVVTAACNLAAMYGLDMCAAMDRCYQRNKKRGRYDERGE